MPALAFSCACKSMLAQVAASRFELGGEKKEALTGFSHENLAPARKKSRVAAGATRYLLRARQLGSSTAAFRSWQRDC
jgi:hypothetical protein